MNVGSAYADDLVLFFSDNENLLDGIDTLNDTFFEFGLIIKATKTKIMIFNFSENIPYPETICKLSGVNIDNVKTFFYLGAIIQYNNAGVGEEEITHRIAAAKSAFQQHKHILRNFNIHLSTRIQFLNAFVRTFRLTYRCSAWSVTKQQLQKCVVCYKTMLRKMLRNGFNQTNNYKFTITDKVLLKTCTTTNVSDFIKSQQRKYLAHVIRKFDNATTKKLIFEDSIRKKKGRPNNSLKINVCQYNNVVIKQFSMEALGHQY